MQIYNFCYHYHFFVKLFQFMTRKDEEWDLDLLFRTMTQRRKGEKYIAFIENHSQVESHIIKLVALFQYSTSSSRNVFFQFSEKKIYSKT